MTDLEQRLREALHEDAQRARLVNAGGPPVPEARPLSTSARRRPSGRRLVAVAAAVALIVAASVAVIQNREPTPVDLKDIFPELAPGSTTELPPGPLSPRAIPALVWSGTEMIVWGGNEARESFDDGAAFDPLTGTWRVIAPAPIEGRYLPTVAWTGTEMIVVGGFQEIAGQHVDLQDGAAYNPATDTWRRLPEAPFPLADGWVPAWTGDEVIVLGDGLAGYNPETNEWRRLADPPGEVEDTLVWAGEAVVMTVHEAEVDGPSSLVRYDPPADEWQTVDEEGYADLVAVPDPDGVVRSVLALPTQTGAPVTLLDRAGNVTGTLPGHPGDAETYGQQIEAEGTWVGDEVLFWITSVDSPYSSVQTPQPWALNPETGTWRPFGASAPPAEADLELVAEAGVLLGWGSLHQDGSPTGIAYRPPELGAVLQPVEDPMGLPEPGEQPADPGVAEDQVRAAYAGIFDASRSPEDRAQLSARPEVWLPANEALSAGQYGKAVQDLQAEVDEVVFTSPSHAAVRFQLLASDPQIPKGYRIGDAVLVDGQWRVAITTTCDLVVMAGVQCNMDRP